MSFYDKFDSIKQEIKELYLANDCPFVLATSFGKDSTLQLLLVWETLLTIPLEQRQKPVYVISSDTLVELDTISAYISESLDMVQQKAKELNLPIEVRKVVPNMNERYFWNVLGKGNPPVVPTSKRFRWCTSKLKQRPVDRVIREIQQSAPIGMYQDYDLYLFLGTRDSESSQRKASMDKFSVDGAKFGRHNQYERVCTYFPIRYLHSDEVWAYLYDYQYLPWGMPLSTLESFYPDGVMECSIQTDQKNSCGGGRNGCWICTFVTEDNMLLDEIKKGNQAAYYLNEYKKLLATIRNDLRYREPLRRIEQKRVSKRMNEQQQEDIFFNLFEVGTDEEKQHSYESFQRANDTDYTAGSFTFEARKQLLEHLLYIEKIVGFKLIDDEEVNEIIKLWKEEGFLVTDIQPKPFLYDGAIVYNEKFEIKEKETTNPYPAFWITREFDCGRDEVIVHIRKREQETGKSFYFTLNHWDFGEDDGFVYNIANFLVCQEGVESEYEAGKLIDDWLYEKPKGWTWSSYAKSVLMPVSEVKLKIS